LLHYKCINSKNESHSPTSQALLKALQLKNLDLIYAYGVERFSEDGKSITLEQFKETLNLLFYISHETFFDEATDILGHSAENSTFSWLLL